ncbi:MAG: hypothetical protein Ct9H300mP1_34140 [Planctomycetaceae bacterium]|nr:MAG: hypothetical protein Ct9H300mP1_34140 [Planctomycetaceae bacterium]
MPRRVRRFLRRPDESRLLLESLQYFPDAELFFFDRRQMVTQVEQALQKKQVPALVVHIPYREVLLTRAGAGSETTAFYLESVGEFWEAQAFAKLIQADYVDGAEAFKGYGVEEIRACWLPLDGHWNQPGCRAFLPSSWCPFFRGGPNARLTKVPVPIVGRESTPSEIQPTDVGCPDDT